MSIILAKKTKNGKKTAENQKNTKYQSVS